MTTPDRDIKAEASARLRELEKGRPTKIFLGTLLAIAVPPLGIPLALWGVIAASKEKYERQLLLDVVDGKSQMTIEEINRAVDPETYG